MDDTRSESKRYSGLIREFYGYRLLRNKSPTAIVALKTAKQIGLEIPQWTLMKADRVIR